jgi:hypothetical protein
MSTLEQVLEEECSEMTDEQSLAHVKAKTITIDGVAESGYVLAYAAGINKLSVVRAIAADAESPLQDAADAAIVTIEKREGFDFSDPYAVNLMEAFVTGGVFTQIEADTIRIMGQSEVSEFPDTTIRDIISITSPSSVISSESNTILNNGKNRTHDLELVITGSVPAVTLANIMIRHSATSEWRRVDGFPNIGVADTYYRRLPSEFIKENTEIKCVCSYALNMSLTAKAV